MDPWKLIYEINGRIENELVNLHEEKKQAIGPMEEAYMQEAIERMQSLADYINEQLDIGRRDR